MKIEATLKIREYRGFQIQLHPGQNGWSVEVWRKERLLQAVPDPDDPEGLFHSEALAMQAAKDWIDSSYRKPVPYIGRMP